MYFLGASPTRYVPPRSSASGLVKEEEKKKKKKRTRPAASTQQQEKKKKLFFYFFLMYPFPFKCMHSTAQPEDEREREALSINPCVLGVETKDESYIWQTTLLLALSRLLKIVRVRVWIG